MLRVFYQFCERFIGVASILSVLRVFYQCCECFISVASVLSVLWVFYQKNGLFEFFSTSIYQASIICTSFNLNRHTSMQAAGTRLLVCKHRMYGSIASFNNIMLVLKVIIINALAVSASVAYFNHGYPAFLNINKC